MIKTHQLKGNNLIDRLKKLSNPINESVSMVEMTKNRVSPTGKLMKTWNNPESFEDKDMDDEVDLDEILRQMGCYNEEDQEIELGDSTEDDIREYIRDVVRKKFVDEVSDDEFEGELQELINELEDEMMIDKVLEELGLN